MSPLHVIFPEQLPALPYLNSRQQGRAYSKVAKSTNKMRADQRMDRHFIYYKNSLGLRYCTIRYLEPSQMLIIIWKGTAPEESIKEVEAGIMEMITRYPCRSIVNDVQDLFNTPSKILADLTRSEWDEKVAVNSGVQFIAHILPPHAALPAPRKENQAAPETRFFHHKMDAIEWLNWKKQE